MPASLRPDIALDAGAALAEGPAQPKVRRLMPVVEAR